MKKYRRYLRQYSKKMLSYRRETALQGTLVLAERGRLEPAVRFNSLSYVYIVHAVQNTVDSCINSATDRRGHLAHLYRRRNPYPLSINFIILSFLLLTNFKQNKQFCRTKISL